MPRTWAEWSKQVFGYVEIQSAGNEKYVVKAIVTSWVEQGMTNAQIFLRYNAGHATQCSSGYNSQGVWYDSCAYVSKGLQHLASL